MTICTHNEQDFFSKFPQTEWIPIKSEKMMKISSGPMTEEKAKNIADQINQDLPKSSEVIRSLYAGGSKSGFFVQVKRDKITKLYQQISKKRNRENDDIEDAPSSKKFPLSILELNETAILTPKEIIDKLNKAYLNAQQQLEEAPNPLWDSTTAKEIPVNCETWNEVKLSMEEVGKIGLASTIGRRKNMEDAHLIDIVEVYINDEKHRIPIFGIFDGHSQPNNTYLPEGQKTQGQQWSQFAAQKFPSHLQKYFPGIFAEATTEDDKDLVIFNFLKTVFHEIQTQEKAFPYGGGTTALVAFIFKDNLWVANLGDSRAILDLNGKAIGLSRDQEPSVEECAKSVENRYGIIVSTDSGLRVYLNDEKSYLAMTHCIGHDPSTSGLNPRPKIVKIPLEPSKERLLIMACDGLWDVVSPKQVVEEVHNMVKSKASCETIALELMRKAYWTEKEIQGQKFINGDNISVLVVDLSRKMEKVPTKSPKGSEDELILS